MQYDEIEVLRRHYFWRVIIALPVSILCVAASIALIVVAIIGDPEMRKYYILSSISFGVVGLSTLIISIALIRRRIIDRRESQEYENY